MTEEDQQLKVNTDYPANIYLFKVNVLLVSIIDLEQANVSWVRLNNELSILNVSWRKMIKINETPERVQLLEAYLGPCNRSTKEFFAIIVDGF